MDKLIDGMSYRFGQLTPMTQFHVARRLAPVLMSVGTSIDAVFQAMDAEQGVGPETLQAVSPIVEAISKLSDQDSEYVIKACLSVVSVAQQGGYAPVLNQATGQLMFSTIRMPTMLKLVYEVAQKDLGDFFVSPAPDSASSGTSTPGA